MQRGPISPVAITVACWGDYWEKFGNQYVEMLSKLNPFPYEIIIVTDQKLKTPGWIQLVQPRSSIQKWDWINEAVEYSQAEWVCVVGIDDIYFPDAFDGLDFGGDVISFPSVEDGEVRGIQGDWDDVLYINRNIMWGGTVFRRDVFLRYPWRRLVWTDWIQWMEMKHAKVDLRIDPKARFIHTRHSTAHSFVGNRRGDMQAEVVRGLLLSNSPIPDNVDRPIRFRPRKE